MARSKRNQRNQNNQNNQNNQKNRNNNRNNDNVGSRNPNRNQNIDDIINNRNNRINNEVDKANNKNNQLNLFGEDMPPPVIPQNQSFVRINYSKKLKEILKELDDASNYAAFELIWMSEPKTKYHNGLRIAYVDVSKDKYSFAITTAEGKKENMSIRRFLQYYLGNILQPDEITKFIKEYNAAKNNEPITVGTPIKVGKFKYDPMDVRSTFLSMVTKTYPHPLEDEVLEFLPELNKDSVGNYYRIIGGGNPESMFCCHLDTADRAQKVVNLFSDIKNDEEYIITDGNSILGADDKAGATVLVYMMANKVPGIYYFFIGEERGGIGSRALSHIYDSVDYLQNIKRCVAFDRRDYHSIITQQMGGVCCSNIFGTALSKEYNKYGLNLSLDPTGIYTDSASFTDCIPECTNISVGYKHEHTGSEYQNITYLDVLAKASVQVDWNSLPVSRRFGMDRETLKKHATFITAVKKEAFDFGVKIIGDNGDVFLRCDLEGGDIDGLYDSLVGLSAMLKKHKIGQSIEFDQTYIKIELK